MKEHLTWPPLAMMFLLAACCTALISFVIIGGETAQFEGHLKQCATNLAEEQRKATILGGITSMALTDQDVRDTATGKLPPDNRQVMEKMEQIFNRFDLDNMMIMASDGTVNAYRVKNVATSITGKNFAWRPYFTGPMVGSSTMYAAFGSNSHERGFYVSTPIPATGSNGVAAPQPIGVMVAKLGFDEIDALLAKQKAPFAVLSPEGVVFASNIPSWRYRVLGSEHQLELAKKEKRVNNAYKDTPPELIKLSNDGTINVDGKTLNIHSTSINWPDPSGTWLLAGFTSSADMFGWTARIITTLALFLVQLPVYTWLQVRQKAKRRAEQVVTLLNNSGEGFLSFGRSLLVDLEYSKACESMLGTAPAGQDVTSLLFADQPEKRELMRKTIASVLTTQDSFISDSMLSLLPAEINVGKSLLTVEYRRIGEEKFMVILSDVTEQRVMAEQLELEQLHLKQIVMAVSDSRNFFETVDSFREFLDHLEENLALDVADQQTVAIGIYRELHTYKGLLSQYSFISTPDILHRSESALSQVMADTGKRVTASIISSSISPEVIRGAFDVDLKRLTDALGEDFLTQGRSLVLSEKQAQQLEDISCRLLRGEQIDTVNHEVRSLLHEITNLRKISLSTALKGYSRLVEQTGIRLGKQIEPLFVEGGDDVWIDPQLYKPFLQSLVHIFRNAVIHGIETPEIRWEHDKNESGIIRCGIKAENDQITLIIADDGSGLDFERLRSKAVESGIAEAGRMNNDQLAELVFRDQFSTQLSVNELAGRGVGLSVVRQETEKLGGKVMVHSAFGVGTEFIFTIPFLPKGEKSI